MAQPASLLDETPIKALASNLFPERWVRPQAIVPFLGAGASLPTPVAEAMHDVTAFPDKAKIEAVLRDLDFPPLETISGNKKLKRERLILQLAIALAYLMIERARNVSGGEGKLFDKLVEDQYPPSAGKLIDFFVQLSQNSGVQQSVMALMKRWPDDWQEPAQEAERAEWMEDLQSSFKLLIEAARLWGANDPLTTVAAHYETLSDRQRLWNELFLIFKDKHTPTKTHQLVAEAAREHLDLANKRIKAAASNEDVSALINEAHYLVVTTNYDCLLEEALGPNVPWVALYSKRPATSQTVCPVSVRFSDYFSSKKNKLTDRHSNQFADKFDLDVDEPLVVIFKIHGSLHPDQKLDDDSVVITDFDYEDYLARMGEAGHNVVPSSVGLLLHHRSFLFMGYSLSDWNIRTILTTLMRKRAEGQTSPDHAVMQEISKSAEAYCRRRKIEILPMTLDAFADAIQKHRPRRV